VFTGLVEGTGDVLAVEARPEGRRLRLRVPRDLGPVQVGESLAVDGVCLTVAAVSGGADGDGLVAEFDLVPETLCRTTLGARRPGDRVNLERSLPVGGRLGGHLVQGHVDGVGTVTAVAGEGGGRWLEVALPAGLERYVVEKGAIALDGVSLTVAAVRDGGRIGVALVPHTLAATTLGTKAVGDLVNVEVDVVARYVERLLRREDGEGR